MAESDERLSRYLDVDEAVKTGTGGGEVEHIQEKPDPRAAFEEHRDALAASGEGALFKSGRAM